MPELKFDDYALLDCGGGRKLERFAGYTVVRPAVAATEAVQHPELWGSANAEYVRTAKGREWQVGCEPPANWQMTAGPLRFGLRLAAGGQVGIFPEQLTSWQWLQERAAFSAAGERVLNAFAYTGGATLALMTAGSAVQTVHLDGSRPAVKWAQENAVRSGVTGGVSWVVEDVLTFMKREVKRKHRYSGLIFDPPAFGRGPAGEWSLTRDLPVLLDLAAALMADGGFFLLSMHEPGMTGTELVDLVARHGVMPRKTMEHGGLHLTAHSRILTAGVYARGLSG